MLFDSHARLLASHAKELGQIFPANGWVEHDGEEIWRASIECCRAVLKDVRSDEIAIGITNQRETSLLWHRSTGVPLHNAIVWQDRRTAERCQQLVAAGHDREIADRTGLLIDPYFSATKLEWLLDHVSGAREQAERGELAFGTVDSWLLYKMTGGRTHATDVTNASRTMLMDLARQQWDERLLEVLRIPRAVLPDIRDSAGVFGYTDPELFGVELPICGVAGDQQAAMVGQACFAPGDVKSTYGTGCFALVNTGPAISKSQHRLLATAAYRVGGQVAYAIEGSIFIAGAVVQWLRDALGLIDSAEEIESFARSAKPADGLYFVPAFTGLGAPYWDPVARGAIVGLTRDCGAAELGRAALDAVCYQTRDLLEAMREDMVAAGLSSPKALKVDGGMVRNDWFCQRLADLTGLPVERPVMTETTALGAAYLAGLGAGLYRDFSDVASAWALERRFEPTMSGRVRDTLYGGWQGAVKRVRN
jgi:glycerol kinase